MLKMKTIYAISLLSAILMAFSAQAAPVIQENDSAITLSAGKSRLVFSKTTGIVKSLRIGGSEFVYKGSGPRPNYWRAMTDLDKQLSIPTRSAAWREHSLNPRAIDTLTWTEDDGAVTLRVNYEPACSLTYTLYENGSLEVLLFLDPTVQPFQEPMVLDGPGMYYNPDEDPEERAARIEEFRAMQARLKASEYRRWLEEIALIPRVGVRMEVPEKYTCEEREGQLYVTFGRGRGFVLQPNHELAYTFQRLTVEDLEAGRTEARPFSELCIDAIMPDTEGVGPYVMPSVPVSLGFTITPLR